MAFSPKPTFARRQFLRNSLLGVGGVLGVTSIGATVFLSNEYRVRYGQLLYLRGHLADIVHTFAEAALPQGQGFPTVEEAKVVPRLDEEFYFIDPTIQNDFKAVLFLVEAIPLWEGYFSRFSRLSREDRVASVSYTHLTLPTICSV